MSQKIVCLLGNKGVGKSTIAMELSTSLEWKHISFAHTMRDMLSAGFGEEFGSRFTDKECPRNEFCGKSIRHVMTTLGTEWGRNMIHEDIWVNALVNRIRRCNSKYIVIDDLRMTNEYKAMESMGAYFIRLTRKYVDLRQNIINSKILLNGGQLHESELHWPSFKVHFTCENDSVGVTVDDIYEFCTECE